MSIHVKLNKGANIKLVGVPNRITNVAPDSEFYALKPSDFHGVTPKLLLKDGARVEAGTPVFFDKQDERVVWSSPVSGEIEEVVRGDRRKILAIKIKSDNQFTAVDYGVTDLSSIESEELKKKLYTAGLWPFIKQRPFDVIANPSDQPKAIFVSSFDTAPLAPDYDYILEQKSADFKTGLKALAKLSKTGKVNLNLPILKDVSFNETEVFSYEDASGKSHSVNFHTANNSPVSSQGKTALNAVIKKYSTPSELFTKSDDVALNTFEGPHPVGNVGVQIHHINPINANEVVWTVNVQDVAIIGSFINSGKYTPKRTLALTGSEVKIPQYYEIRLGAELKTVLGGGLKDAEENPRFISGNVLTGVKIAENDYIGFYHNQITVIPEGDKMELFGWALPVQPEKLSFSRTLWSWLVPNKKYRLNTNLNGEERPFVVTGQYELLVPMNVLPVQLIKACMIQDIELLEGLGIYEVVPEDFALCEFSCSSKIPVQTILREALDLVKKECA